MFWDSDFDSDVHLVLSSDLKTRFFLYTLSDWGIDSLKPISKITLNSDENVLDPVLSGELSQEGIVTLTPKLLELTYNCKESEKDQSSIIELNFEMEDQNSVQLFFKKNCDGVVL